MPHRIVLSLLAASLFLPAHTLFSGQVARRAWIRDVDQALQEAESQQRPVLLFVSMDRCKYCQQMAQTTLRDLQVRQAIGTHFVPAVIKNSDRPDLMRELQIQSFPTTLIVSPHGKVLQEMKGYVDASKFHQQLLKVAGQPTSTDRIASREPRAKRPTERGSALRVQPVSTGRRQAASANGAFNRRHQGPQARRNHQGHKVHPAQSGFRWPFGLDRLFTMVGARR
jgi:thioredoxin-related protein